MTNKYGEHTAKVISNKTGKHEENEDCRSIWSYHVSSRGRDGIFQRSSLHVRVIQSRAHNKFDLSWSS